MMLVYPVSTNKVWKHGKNRVYLNPKVVDYRTEVWAATFGKTRFENDERLKLEINMWPPRKNCDIDNILKTLLDALQHARVFANDNQIDELIVHKMPVRSGGEIEITLTDISPEIEY